ncbi:MAG: fructosamine kinase family protein, partial [Actinomycetota bacterium]|nr:fructosamine kinase family protein [Actinomycetota bacterium]
ARGLRWLAAAAAGGGVSVPELLACDDDCVIVAWVEPGRPTPEAAEAFGQALAATHAAGAESFGAAQDGFIGPLPLPNQPVDDWATFWATRRVLPYLRAARDRAAVTDAEAATVEAVLGRLEELAGPAEPPARLHGDLWSGNLVWAAEGHVWVVDPAAYGGHRETDLAMLALFGAPHLARTIAAYVEAAPLADGWRERAGLHQLHPLLVHAVLFGGGYGSRAAQAAQSVLDGRPTISVPD